MDPGEGIRAVFWHCRRPWHSPSENNGKGLRCSFWL